MKQNWSNVLTALRPEHHILLTKTEVQFRFPKSKKKRIRRKWAKNKKNFRNFNWVKDWQIVLNKHCKDMTDSLLRTLQGQDRAFLPSEWYKLGGITEPDYLINAEFKHSVLI